MLAFGRVVAAAALLALSGCATATNWSPEKLAAGTKSDGAGVVLLSAGAPGSCVAKSTFLKVMADGQRYSATSLALLPVDSYVARNDFQDHFGAVFALRLPAGRYYLTTWVANPYLTIASPPRYDFSVGAGETVYLGEWRTAATCSGGAAPVVVNEWERDRGIISQRNPAIDLSNVSQRMAALSPAGAPE